MKRKILFCYHNRCQIYFQQKKNLLNLENSLKKRTIDKKIPKTPKKEL